MFRIIMPFKVGFGVRQEETAGSPGYGFRSRKVSAFIL